MTDRAGAGAPPPTSELGPSGAVADAEVLAAVARAECQEARVTVREIANHLGWRHSGQATLRLRPPLGRLVASGLLDSTDPPRRRIRAKEWSTTAAGGRRAASAGPVDLPESPQHRRWRQDRDLAAWAMDGIRAEGREVVEVAYDLFWQRRDGCPITRGEIERLKARFDKAMKAFAVATRMCEEWPEPSEGTVDEDAPHFGDVSLLLPEQARKKGRS